MNFLLVIYSVAVVGQSCTKADQLVDDFSKIDIHDYQGAQRYFNILGGDYGQVGITARYDTAAKNVELNADKIDNFWFTKFDLNACFDLSGYTAIQFDIVAQQGTTATFTLTQRSADCQKRLIDSQYVSLSKYITPNGMKQTVTLPLADFSKNINGGDFDFLHLKDWTLVNLNPVGAKVNISNLVLKGNCPTVMNATSTTALMPPTVVSISSARGGRSNGFQFAFKYFSSLLLLL